MSKANFLTNLKTILKCQTNLYFGLDGGGANILSIDFQHQYKSWNRLALFVALLFGAYLTASAQPAFGIPSCTSMNNLRVEVVPISTPICGGVECNRSYFQVRLATNLPFAGDPVSFFLKYELLSVTIKLVTDPVGGLSSVNEPQTNGCLPSGFSGFPLGFDGNEVTFFVSGDCDATTTPNILFTRGIIDPPYIANLFVIAVDGIPDEDVLFELVGSTYTCPDLSIYCYDPLPFYSDVFNVPAPSGNEGQVCLDFDAYDTGTDLLPVIATNSNGSAIEAEYLSFTAVIDADNPINKPKLLNFVQTPVASSVDPIPGTDDWRVFVRFENSTGITVPEAIMMSPGEIKLFDIEITGPVNESLETNVEVCITEGQMRRSGSTCRNACLPVGCADIPFVGESACDPEIFTVVVSAEEPGSTCTELEVRVQLNWCCGPSSPSDFDQIRIAVEFDLAPGVTIEDIGTNTFGCPSNTDCNMSSFDNCFLIDGNRVTFCFLPTTAESVSLGSYFTVLFNAPVNCVNGAIVREALVDMDGEDLCVANTWVETEDFPLCSPILAGWVKNANGQNVDDVDVVISLIPPDGGCPPDTIWPNNSSWSWCPCDPGEFRVKPQVRYDDAWLNGVTTYDAVLIARHLSDPLYEFTSIYQYAAADADNNSEIQEPLTLPGTPPDIIELRKLILGIYDVLPNNNSWRYFLASDSGTLPASDPFDPFTLPDEQWFDNPSDPDINFVAVKVGDVNNSHNTDLELRPVGILPLLTEALPRTVAGEFVNIPIRYQGTVPLTALQMGLRFDTEAWEFVGVTASDVPQVSEGCFNLSNTAGGEIKFAWYCTLQEEYVRSNQTLFFLTLRTKSVSRGYQNPLLIDNSLLRSVAYAPEGAIYNLSMGAEASLRDLDAPSNRALDVVCSPNPASGTVSLSITTASEAATATVWAYSAFGSRLLRREIPLTGRTTDFQFPESANWPAGLYVWKVKVDDAKTEGRLLKQ